MRGEILTTEKAISAIVAYKTATLCAGLGPLQHRAQKAMFYIQLLAPKAKMEAMAQIEKQVNGYYENLAHANDENLTM